MRLHTNSSNNTVYADAEGNIAYFHSNFIPMRDTQFNWLRPVDGSDPATEWQGIHPVEDAPNSLIPSIGWFQNTNNWPFSVSGATSPRKDDFPVYVQRSGENSRGTHAIMVLENVTDFTISSLIDAAYDSYLPGFEEMIPSVVRAYDEDPDSRLSRGLAGEIDVLRGWDLRWSVESVATSLAVFYGEELMRRAREAGGAASDGLSGRAQLEALAAARLRLLDDFGTWEVPWGDINRFQRLNGDIVQPFNDDGASFPVGFTSSRWGSLASFGARRYPGTKKFYGTSGNSFVAVVEFGDSVRARAITAGGLNSDPDSPHFNDQAARYATGDLRDVYFYPNQLEGHIEREYHPGG